MACAGAGCPAIGLIFKAEKAEQAHQNSFFEGDEIGGNGGDLEVYFVEVIAKPFHEIEIECAAASNEYLAGALDLSEAEGFIDFDGDVFGSGGELIFCAYGCTGIDGFDGFGNPFIA